MTHQPPRVSDERLAKMLGVANLIAAHNDNGARLVDALFDLRDERATRANLEAELHEAHAEILEQARLLGISSERELSLQAEIERLRLGRTPT